MSNSTTNHYPALITSLQSRLYLNSKTSSYNLQLYIASSLLIISLLATILSLGIKVKRGNFWLFRTIKTGEGIFWAPHPVIIYQIWCAIFLGVLQGYLYTGIQYGILGSNLLDIMLWRNLIWIPLYFGAWFLCWATLLAPLLTRSMSYSSSFSLSSYPTLVNIIFTTLPFLLLATVVPLTLITNKRYNNAFTAATALIGILEVANAQVQLGKVEASTLAAELKPLLSVVTGLETEMELLIESWKRVWIAWLSFTLLFLILYVYAAITYSRSLNISISNLRSKVRNNSVGTTSDSSSSQLNVLIWSYRTLIFTEVLIACIGFCYLIMSVTLSIKTAEVAQGGVIAELVTLVSIWIFAFMGTLSCLALLFRSFTSPSASTSSLSSSKKSKVKIGLPSKLNYKVSAIELELSNIGREPSSTNTRAEEKELEVAEARRDARVGWV